MKKIISLFQRNYDGDRLVRDEVVPGAEWVQAGEGVARRKLDGTCCLIRDGKLYKRYEAIYRPIQPGGDWQPLRPLPAAFEPITELDTNTGKVQGWVPVGDGPEDRWHREAFDKLLPSYRLNGTYELVGPKVQNNNEGYHCHALINHEYGTSVYLDCPRDFEGLKTWLAEYDIEGIVWHHPDGRLAKIKAKDFGLKRKKRGDK